MSRMWMAVMAGSFLVAGSSVAGAQEQRLALPDALRLLKTESAMASPATNRLVMTALKDLDEAGRAQLLAELVPLITNPPQGARQWAAWTAFPATGPEGMKPLLAVLTGEQEDRKVSFALNALCQYRSNAVAVVSPLVKNPDFKVRSRAFSILSNGTVAGALTAPPAVLAELLKSGEAADRRDSLRALLAYAPKAAPLRDEVIRLASTDPDASVRIYAVKLLAAMGNEPGPVVEALVPLLGNASLSLRAEALEALEKRGTNAAAAVTAVAGRLQDGAEDPYIRRLAASALAKAGPSGVAVLAKALGELDEETAYQAAFHLGGADLATAVPAALEALQKGNTQAKRFAAFALAKAGPKAKDAYDALAAAAADADTRVRRNALEALGRLGDPRGEALLVPALKDKVPGVARAAAGALETLVTNAPRAEGLLADYRQATAWKQPAGPEPKLGLAEKELEKYEIGGPLAGLRLPLFKGQHGEEPGYPGSIPELIATGTSFTDMNNTYSEWGPQGMAPEVELYPGAVEHWRNYMFKYYPTRSFFDVQSQLRNWAAPAIPGVDKSLVETFAEPVYHVPRHNPPRATGKFRQPVPVVRCSVGKPVLALDLGVLDRGLYVVRVIGAVENKNPRRFLEPLFMRFSVNDGLKGGTSRYRIKCGYVDQFYSIAEFYFHAVEKRAYKAEVAVDEGSRMELLVHNLTLDDALAGTTRQAVKRRPVMASVPARVALKSKLLAEERLAQDAEIWRAQPALNRQGSGGYWPTRGGRTGGDAQADVAVFGLDGLSEQQLEARFGSWQGAGKGDLALINPTLGLRYTMRQFEAGEPLPDPYPFKDSGAGLYQPDPKDPDKGNVWAPIADWVFNMRRLYGSPDSRPNADNWVKNGDSDAAREEAVRLIRLAWQLPGMDIANGLAANSCIPAAYNRDIRCRRRETYADYLSHYPNYIQPPVAYDKLFTYIDGNEELAQSVSRFVPWVKTSKDLVELLDVYLLQTITKRVMRYHYATGPTEAGDAALLQDNRSLTSTWIDWLFSRTFVYPLRPAGLQNVMITGCDRNGPEFVGSAYYSQGEGASRTVKSTERFLKAGILPEKYDLTKTDLYPKPLAHCYWQLAVNVAGREFLRVGDVTGADKTPGFTLLNVPEASVNGWNWSRDPRFAWVLANMGKPEEWNADEWKAIGEAAGRVPRAPWLDQPSRHLYNWAGILETGFTHDDWRFRRAVYVRTGLGMGHQHSDSLDLEVVAHGLPMTMDAGQRNGYSVPASGMTRCHNLVEVNGRGHYVQSWGRTLADAPGARYMELAAEPPNGATFFRRQVALVDVDEGSGSQPLTVTLQLAKAVLPAGVKTANSYVFDVFRVAGGQTHTYCFHGPVSDELTVNDKGRKPVPPAAEGAEPTADQAYLAPFGAARETWFAGDGPGLLTATWRYTRQGTGNEAQMAGKDYEEGSPRKYTALHLFDTDGLRVLQGAYNCHNNGYRLHNVFAQKRGAEGDSLETAFAALIEPYAGETFLADRRMLAIPGNESDAKKAVAVEVKTKNGHTDVLFADGRPDRERSFEAGGAAFKAAGEFAFYSTDAQGFRLASLAGGTRLEGPEVRIAIPVREYTGTVTAVNYLKKQVTVDADYWPAGMAGRTMEIGTTKRTTSYGLVSVSHGPNGKGSVLELDGGADYYQAVIESLDETSGVAVCAIKTALGMLPGLDKDFTASNDQMTKWWRADYLDDMKWKLSGAPVTTADFQPSRFLRVWEYGVGDKVRASTDASARRLEDGSYELRFSAGLTLALKAKGLELSADRKKWAPLEGKAQDGWFTAELPPTPRPALLYVRRAP